MTSFRAADAVMGAVADEVVDEVNRVVDEMNRVVANQVAVKVKVAVEVAEVEFVDDAQAMVEQAGLVMAVLLPCTIGRQTADVEVYSMVLEDVPLSPTL